MKKLLLISSLVSVAAMYAPEANTAGPVPKLTCTYTDETTKDVTPDPSMISCAEDGTLDYKTNLSGAELATFIRDTNTDICKQEEPGKEVSGYDVFCVRLTEPVEMDLG